MFHRSLKSEVCKKNGKQHKLIGRVHCQELNYPFSYSVFSLPQIMIFQLQVISLDNVLRQGQHRTSATQLHTERMFAIQCTMNCL